MEISRRVEFCRRDYFSSMMKVLRPLGILYLYLLLRIYLSFAAVVDDNLIYLNTTKEIFYNYKQIK